MNSNYYNNPYVNPYYQQQAYQQPVQPQIQQVQQMQQMQQAQSHMIPMVYVNGLVGAKSYWMGTNQIVYLRDSEDDSILYEKKSDSVGKFQLKAFKLSELPLDNKGGFVDKTTDEIKLIHQKLDTIYNLVAPKEVNVDESVIK